MYACSLGESLQEGRKEGQRDHGRREAGIMLLQCSHFGCHVGSSNQIMSAPHYQPGHAKPRCPLFLESVPLTTLDQQRTELFRQTLTLEQQVKFIKLP